MILIVALTFLVLTLSDIGPPATGRPDDAEIALVKARLEPLQHLSFATDREYCGYLIRGRGGALAFTDMVRGGEDGCTPVIPLTNVDLVASVHTHGAYDASVPAEFPTALDMESDRRERVNGYVATPGGRLWYIDSAGWVTYQLCSLGCLPQDPEFRAGDDGVIAERYTYRDLIGLESPQ